MRYGILEFKDQPVDHSRKILHVDMDAFYAAIEIRDNPALKDQPVVIARHPKETGGRGIVATCNYIARTFGIRSAMPAIEAYRRCPQAIFIPGRHAYYRQVSLGIRKIFHQYTDLVEPISVDEAYLDVTDNKQGFTSATWLAQQLQRDIYQQTQLTCSIGVSYNKYIAKIASDFHKPKGITLVEPDHAQEFLWNLPIGKFRGIGKKSQEKFQDLGIMTGHDLYKQSLEDLIKHFGKLGYSLYFKVRGIHNDPVSPVRDRKSLGKETTFRHFLQTEEEVLRALKSLTDQVASQLTSRDLWVKLVTIKIRYEDFSTYTRQMATHRPIQQAEDIYPYVEDLWLSHGDLGQGRIRLLGVTTSDFEDPSYQLVSLL